MSQISIWKHNGDSSLQRMDERRERGLWLEVSLPRRQKSGVNWSQVSGQTGQEEEGSGGEDGEGETEETGKWRGKRESRREIRERGERTEWGGMRKRVRDHSRKGDEDVRREIAGEAFSTRFC